MYQSLLFFCLIKHLLFKSVMKTINIKYIRLVYLDYVNRLKERYIKNDCYKIISD